MKVRNLTAAAVMAVIICICSWISVPIVIPFTMQTFAVFMALYLLGGRLGMISIVIYILLGAAGLPVFAGFQGGLGHLMGPTGGYILGFLTLGSIYLIGESLVRARSRNNEGLNTGQQRVMAVFQILGLISCYVCGTVWYKVMAGNDKSMLAVACVCVLPYIVPDLAKLWLAGFTAGRLKKHINGAVNGH